jgi:hypothetical protein
MGYFIFYVNYKQQMRPQLYKLPLAPDSSFLYIDEECKYFDKPWHLSAGRYWNSRSLVICLRQLSLSFLNDL